MTFNELPGKKDADYLGMATIKIGELLFTSLMLFFRNWKLKLGLICLVYLPKGLAGQDYQINQIIPYLSQDSLKADVLVENIFQEKILRTLLAGIPLDIELKLSLMNQRQETVSQREFNCKVSYDVWEEHFWLFDYWNNTIDFSELVELQNWSRTIANLGLVHQDLLSTQIRYMIRAEMRIQVLGAQESQQLKWWIENSDQTEEELASRERSTGFKLNLNQLVQMFFSREETEETYIVKQTSDYFTLPELKFQ
jgi:hypothetical protein